MRRIPRVSFECPLATSYGREVLRGIVSFARVGGPWDLRAKKLSPLISGGDRWNIDGVIICTRDEIAPIIHAAGVPAVNVINPNIDLNIPRVSSDDIAVGRLGAEHFIERGFRQFAFCGFSREAYSNSRCKGFVQTIRSAGFDCCVRPPEVSPDKGRREENSLDRWVAGLPTPLGLMVCNDRHAWRVAEVCLRLGLQIPEQVAILGVNNDPFFCEMSYPFLSSIALPTERIGYEAATLLAKLMAGKSTSPKPILIPPLGVVTRHSTNTLAIEDQDVAQAVSFIREHADKPIQVEDVLAAVPLSRRMLERRFREVLKRSPQEEIRRVHVERAKILLAESEISVHEVALACGFTDPNYFSSVFHECTGLSPTSYRRQFCKVKSNHAN